MPEINPISRAKCPQGIKSACWVSRSWAMSIPVCCNGSRLRHPYSVGNVQLFFTFYAFASDCTTVTLAPQAWFVEYLHPYQNGFCLIQHGSRPSGYIRTIDFSILHANIEDCFCPRGFADDWLSGFGFDLDCVPSKPLAVVRQTFIPG
jgi:hypothetical protein